MKRFRIIAVSTAPSVCLAPAADPAMAEAKATWT